MFCQNCSHLLRIYSLNTFFRFISRRSSKATTNHYETLKLKQDCSQKDIRTAFIKLSKENHPDVNKCTSSHEKFLRINEAYNVLSKPQSRRSYDLGLSNIYSQYNNGPNYTRDFYHAPRAGYRQYYAHGTPVERVPKSLVGLGCMLLIFFGIGLQFLAISHSVKLKRDLMKRRSDEAQAELDKLRAKAYALTKEEQIKALRLRLLGHENEDDHDDD